MTPAEKGKQDLIDHLKSSGTGKEKLETAAKADISSATTARDGIAATIAHMRLNGVAEGTLAKADKYLEALTVPTPKPQQTQQPQTSPRPNRPPTPKPQQGMEQRPQPAPSVKPDTPLPQPQEQVETNQSKDETVAAKDETKPAEPATQQ